MLPIGNTALDCLIFEFCLVFHSGLATIIATRKKCGG